jgi:hypothetical protein
VDFQPQEDVKQTRKLLFRELKGLLGNTIFDGASLYATRPFATLEHPAVHDVKHPIVISHYMYRFFLPIGKYFAALKNVSVANHSKESIFSLAVTEVGKNKELVS